MQECFATEVIHIGGIEVSSVDFASEVLLSGLVIIDTHVCSVLMYEDEDNYTQTLVG
jgi:hypothetical protein